VTFDGAAGDLAIVTTKRWLRRARRDVVSRQGGVWYSMSTGAPVDDLRVFRALSRASRERAP